MNKQTEYIKRIIRIAVCVIMLLAIQLPWVSAAEVNNDVFRFRDGLTIIETVEVVSQARASTTEKTVRKNFEITDGSDVIADITIRGTFEYNGSDVKVVLKEIVQCNTYHGWKFSQTGFSSSGGTITLSGKLSKVLSSKNISLSLSCDKNGNVS